MYEWSKECPKDLKPGLDAFFISKDFLDRQSVFYKGMEDSSQKWVALISMSGIEETHAMICRKFSLPFSVLHEAQNTTFSQVSAAPRMPLAAAYNKFIKDIVKLNKLARSAERLLSYKKELGRATAMVIAPLIGSVSAPESDTVNTLLASLTPSERSAAMNDMWFISVDIESFESDHSKILEIGWSIWALSVNKFVDKHYAISNFRHLKNGKYVADRRDRFMFGDTVWATLKESIAAFQDTLEAAAGRNAQGLFALIAHDMSSDEGYLRKMGVQFPSGMIKFDTVDMNAARVGDANCKTGLGKLLDELGIDNYCLHNAGNDAHYTLELFLKLTRNNIKQNA
ncbi:hypothetical protein BG011_009094 [Mortierella polycephala]|uniref:Gfd2/YDR514C-like C-terminal domain-containing protein n=1 Tax=Mortierella polycephala TaxID=41804 RepID=A0A9P6PPC5_9FUNG|nr:hypothetical protein BG011_009094 [Mortierella polycephala]